MIIFDQVVLSADGLVLAATILSTTCPGREYGTVRAFHFNDEEN